MVENKKGRRGREGQTEPEMERGTYTLREQGGRETARWEADSQGYQQVGVALASPRE